jgi:hypothetical protein
MSVANLTYVVDCIETHEVEKDVTYEVINACMKSYTPDLPTPTCQACFAYEVNFHAFCSNNCFMSNITSTDCTACFSLPDSKTWASCIRSDKSAKNIVIDVAFVIITAFVLLF